MFYMLSRLILGKKPPAIKLSTAYNMTIDVTQGPTTKKRPKPKNTPPNNFREMEI